MIFVWIAVGAVGGITLGSLGVWLWLVYDSSKNGGF
jgi:hypothetical protein